MNRALANSNVLGALRVLDGPLTIGAGTPDRTETVPTGTGRLHRLHSSAADPAPGTGPKESRFVSASEWPTIHSSQASTITAPPAVSPYSGAIACGGVAVPFSRSSMRSRQEFQSNQASWDGAEAGSVGRRHAA